MVNIKDLYNKITSSEFILKNVHNFLIINHGDKKEEYEEQLMCLKYIKPDDKVLEIGGNIGRVSCILSCILKDENKQLVVLESNKDFIPQIKENKDKNNFKFNIESSALSYQRLFQRGWVTFTESELQNTHGLKQVDTINYKELESKYNITFNTLVVDCEGALYHILKDNEGILNNINKIIIENDFNSQDKKEYVDSLFKKYGLKKIFSKPLDERYWQYFSSQYIRDNFYEVWLR